MNMMGQLLLSGFIFSRSPHRKSNFAGWMSLSLFFCLLLMVCSVILRTHIGGLDTRFIMRFIQLGMP